jgi:hypothetical protein
VAHRESFWRCSYPCYKRQSIVARCSSRRSATEIGTLGYARNTESASFHEAITGFGSTASTWRLSSRRRVSRSSLSSIVTGSHSCHGLFGPPDVHCFIASFPVHPINNPFKYILINVCMINICPFSGSRTTSHDKGVNDSKSDSTPGYQLGTNTP